MKAWMLGALAASVMGSGFWAYAENYRTRAAMAELRATSARIATAQGRLDRLQAEWAYLNRPDRLRDLVEVNFDRLDLVPLSPEAFARVDQVAFPPESLGPLLGGVGGTVTLSALAGEEPL